MILDNGMIRDEHFEWRKYNHAVHIPSDQHDALRKRLAENGWTEVDNTCVMDAHEEWTKGEYNRQRTVIFPGCWTKPDGYNTIHFELRIQFKTGYTDYTQEEWNAKWAKRKADGYIVVDTFEIKEPVKPWGDILTRKFNILDRIKERTANFDVDAAHQRLIEWKDVDK